MTSNFNLEWSDAKVAMLKDLHSQRLSSSSIAMRMGITRNAVIGKVSRLGLNGERVKPVSKPRAKKTAPHVPVTKTQIKKERLVLEVSEELPDVTDRIGLADVGHDECKWITGDPKKAHSYCAKPTKPGASWCPAHHRRVYRGRR